MIIGNTPHKFWLPPMFFATSLGASICLAAGLLGLFAPEVLPVLAKPRTAYTLIGLAVFLEGWAIFILISASRAAAKQAEKRAGRQPRRL